MKEPKVPRYNQHISQLCLRRKITAWSENEAFASAMSFMPSHAAIEQIAMNGTQTKAAFCAQISTIFPPLPATRVGSPWKASQIGIVTLLFLGVLLVLAYALKKEYWKDVH